MKQLQRLLWRTGLLVVANSLVASPVHAQEATEQESSARDLKIMVEFLMQGFYDGKPYEANPYFSPASIPLEEDKNKRQRFDLIPNANLGMEKQLPFAGEVLKLVVKTSLDNKAIKLKRAYIEHNNFRAGLAVSNFCAPAVLPAMLTDVPCGAALASVPQLCWKDQLSAGVSYGIAIEKALELDMYPEEKEEAKKDLVPNKNLPAMSTHVKYEKPRGHIQVGGLLRVLDYHEKAKNENQYLATWGTNLAAELKVIPPKTTLKLYGIYGSGIGSYIADFGGVSPKEQKDVYFKSNTALATIGAWGGFVGIEHCWLPKLRSTIAYGILDTTNDKNRGDDAYKQGHCASGNLTYHPTEHLMLGIEYLYGKRFTIADKDGKDAHRVQAAIRFEL